MLNTGQDTALHKTLIIACGATAHEIKAIVEAKHLTGLDVICLPADLHNKPQLIPDRMRAAIHKHRDAYDRILCAYADCGTGGLLDTVLEEEGVERIPGPHCYSFFSGAPVFDAFMEEELGTLFLTDYMVRFFDSIIIAGLGLDRHPELQEMYFGNYKRVLYISQTEDPELVEAARAAAKRLGLGFEHRHVGYGEFADFLIAANSLDQRTPIAKDQ